VQVSEESGRYFRYLAEFIGFTPDDAETIRHTKPIIEKHVGEIVDKFYEHLLRYPPTRKVFLKPDGSIDEPYLELRMRHQANFWLRTAEGVFDDEYASYIDYVGKAHTSRGADPHVYIAERYVIGQVGFISHALNEALSKELRHVDEDFELRAIDAWHKLMMLLLELLSRAYGHEREQETFDALRRDLSVTTLLVTHDLAEAGRLADEVVVMRKGRVEQSGTMRSLISAPATDYVARLIERARAGIEALRA